MEFYEMLSSRYDDVFTISAPELSFLMDSIPEKNSKVLDVACGTGQYAIELYNNGYKRIKAVDLDPSMIRKASDKDSPVDFKVGNMLDISQLYDENFDFIYCTGNSIAHLNTLDQVSSFIYSVYSKLNRGGVFVCQIINFDRIISGSITSLPTIKTTDLIFERLYTHKNDKIIFTGILTQGPEKAISELTLLTLMHKDINHAVLSAGFDQVEYFGSFLMEEYVPKTSYALVMRAIKR